MLCAFLLTHSLIFCTGVYLNSEERRKISIEPESSKEISARSQIECILKCKRLQYEALYTKDKKCWCVVKSMIKESINNGGLNGKLYSKSQHVIT